jgi:predicted DNA-binding protein (MmcQ/YjbR family)
VGHRGWLGVHLDRDIDWEEIAGILEDAYLEIAPPKLAAPALNAVSRDPGGPS